VLISSATQFNGEDTSFARVALEGDLAAKRGEFLAEMQTKTGSFATMGTAFQPRKCIEKFGLVFGFDPNTRISHRNFGQAILASHFDPDLARLGKFNRVVYEIDQDL
jgi:hypothetical protein